MNPVCPPGLAAPDAGRITSYLAEILKLSPAQVRGVTIGLEASLANTTQTTDTYKVPGDQDLVVFTIQGYLSFSAINSEPLFDTYLKLDPSERWFLKSQNCYVDLADIDRSLKVTDARSIPMSAITPPVGQPLVFPVEAPLLFPSNHNVRATFSLIDGTAAVVGNSTKYGLMLTGALIPKRV
jgi:hypothetical protein